MEIRIGNKKIFQWYVYLQLLVLLLLLVYILLEIFKKIFSLDISPSSLLFPVIMFSLLLGVFERILKPTYFEFVFKSEKLSVKIFSPSLYSFNFYFLNYRKYLSEIIIPQKSFNGYSINISKMRLRKILLLQQNTNEGILESKPISLGLTSLTKYTQLIIALDKFKSGK